MLRILYKVWLILTQWFFNFVNIFFLLLPPFKKGAYCFAPVGRPGGPPSVDRSVCEPNDIYSISVKVAKLGTVDAPME